MEKEEEQFTNNLKKELEKDLPEYRVTTGESLIYKFLIDADGQLQPKTFENPKRGQLAFQTDLMIKKAIAATQKSVPLIVIEIKFGRFTTHDVLTYSAKASRHKEIYPYLRYGLVVGGIKKIHRRFFTHNTGFDFGIAVEKLENLPEVTEIVKQQLQAAELLLSVFRGKQVRRYVANIELT